MGEKKGQALAEEVAVRRDHDVEVLFAVGVAALEGVVVEACRRTFSEVGLNRAHLHPMFRLPLGEVSGAA